MCFSYTIYVYRKKCSEKRRLRLNLLNEDKSKLIKFSEIKLTKKSVFQIPCICMAKRVVKNQV